MSTTIDEQIVEMKFVNSQFQRGIKSSLAAIASLKKGLNLDGASKSLNNLNDAGKKFSMGNVGAGVDAVAVKFGALQTVGITALATLANKAVVAGLSIAKSLTIEPVTEGLREYETQLNSVQTILANTKSKGSTLEDVNNSLSELNEYADLTIYNFSEMTRAIGTFTVAGVSLEDSTAAVKGFSNVSALAGANATEAAGAMKQLALGMASGEIRLQDWMSIETAGIGGEQFQQALMTTADVHGIAVDKMIEEAGSFRLTLQEGWLSGEIMTQTLTALTGDLNEAQLLSQGYSKEQAAGLLEMADSAVSAAQDVKTITQLFDVLKEAVGSGWAQTWQLVFGDFESAKEMWTSASGVLTDIIGQQADARNTLLTGWSNLGGRDLVIDAVKNAFQALLGAIEPVKAAWESVFPPITIQTLLDVSQGLADFTEKLKMGEETADKVQRIFKGVFSVLAIGKDILVSALGVFSDLFGAATDGAPDFLELAASFGDWLVSLRLALQVGGDLEKFFSGLGQVLAVPIALVRALGDAFGWLFDKIFGSDDATEGTDSLADRVEKRFEPLVGLIDALGTGWEWVKDKMAAVWDVMQPFADFMSEAFGSIGTSIKAAFEDMDMSSLLDVVNTGLFAGLILIVKKFVDNLGGGEGGGLSGLGESIKEVFGGLTDTLTAMQGQLKANTLLTIAAAVAVLTLSVIGLSLIDPADLAKALGAITAMFLQLMGTMALFDKINPTASAIKMTVIAGGLVVLSVAVLILSAAVRNMSGLGWEELLKGLAGVTGLLLGLAGTAQLMRGAGGKMISAGIGLILVATAIRILVSAVKDFSGMGWDEIRKGLAGVAGLLTALGLFTQFGAVGAKAITSGAGIILLAIGVEKLLGVAKGFAELGWEDLGKGMAALSGILLAVGLFSQGAGSGASLILSATGMVIMGEALKTIVGVVGDFVGFSWEELGRGMAGMAGAMAAIALAIGLLPPSSLLSAAAIFVVALALESIMDAVSVGAGMEWGEIGKGLTLLAGALLIIAVAVTAMIAALPGAVALVVVAGALAILMPIIEHMGTLSWGQIGTGLGALAAALGIMAVAGLLLIPAIPGLMGLGIAIGLIGAGIALAGVGIAAFALGLATLAVASVAGVAAITAIGQAIIALIPALMTAVAEGLVLMATVLGESAPQLVDALVELGTSLLDGLMELAPKLVETIVELVWLLVDTLVENVPKLVEAGAELVTGILEGLADNIGDVVDAASELVVNFLDGMADNIGDVVDAGSDFIVAWLEGVADNIDDIVVAAGGVVVSFIEGMTENVQDIIDAGGDLIIAVISGLGTKSVEIGTAAAEVVVDLIDAFGDNAQDVIDAGGDLIIDLIEGLGTKSVEIAAAALETLLEFLEGIDSAMEKNIPKINATGRSIAGHIINGLTLGLSGKVASIASAGWNLGKQLLGAAERALGIESPSKEFKKIGEFVNEGFAQGLNGKTRDDVKDGFWGLNDLIKDVTKTTKDEIAKQKKELADLKESYSDYDDELAATERHHAQQWRTLNEQKKELKRLEGLSKKERKEEKVGYFEIQRQKEDILDTEKSLREEREKIADMKSQHKQDAKDIKAYESSIKDLNAELTKAGKARSYLLNNLQDEKNKLYKLSDQYEKVTEKLEAANDALADAQNERDSYLSSTKDSYDNFASVDEETDLLEYLDEMREQVDKTAALRISLGKLSKLGLNDKLYKQLLDGGVDSLPFVTQLLEGGKGAILAVNDLNDDLNSEAGKIAKNGSTELYQAGVDAAKGIVDGLASQQKALEKQMEKLADYMVKAIKGKLQIKSPSRVFAEIGGYAGEGMARGLQESTGSVTQAAENMADNAASALREAMMAVGDAVPDEMDINPTITPVLDLSEVKSGAGQIGSLMKGPMLNVEGTANAAAATANAVRDTEDGYAGNAGTDASAKIEFNQYNSSPKALSEVEIYRQTNNQLSKAKGALTT